MPASSSEPPGLSRRSVRRGQAPPLACPASNVNKGKRRRQAISDPISYHATSCRSRFSPQNTDDIPRTLKNPHNLDPVSFVRAFPLNFFTMGNPPSNRSSSWEPENSAFGVRRQCSLPSARIPHLHQLSSRCTSPATCRKLSGGHDYQHREGGPPGPTEEPGPGDGWPHP
jgi:hypothetical protein